MSASLDAPDIMSEEYRADPYAVCERLLEDYPLLWHDGLQAYVVSRFEDVSAVLRDATFSTQPYDDWAAAIHGRTIVNMDGREHAAHRGILTPALRGAGLRTKYPPVIRRNAEELIERFRTAGEVELIEQFTSRYPINITVDILGLPRDDHERFRKWYRSIIAFFYNLAQDPAIIDQGMQTKREIEEYIVPMLPGLRENPSEDLLSTLATAEVDDVQMEDLEVKAFVSLLIVAGGETTDKSMASMIKNLVERPDQLDAVRADRSLIEKAFAETIRFAPPVQVVPRRATQNVELSGGLVEEGRQVFCLLNAANRDPRRFSKPNEFDVFRDDLDASKAYSGIGEHAAFGMGRHFCIGSMLAKQEVETATNMLLDQMADIRFKDGIVPTEVGMFSRGPDAVHLEFTPA